MEGYSPIDTGSGPLGDRTHTPPSFIPDSLLGWLDRAVPRKWLLERVEAFLTRPASRAIPRIAPIVGEPGSGKTILAGQMAEAWRCPCYFVRIGNIDGVAWKDPRSFLIALGLQLRACYGAEIFGPPSLEVRTRIDVSRVESGGQVKGVEVGKVSLSPFQRAIIEVDITIEELAGEALGVRVGEIRDTTDRMSIGRLALEALVKPLQRLATEQPLEQVRIIVDALDESPDVARTLPSGDELPRNVALVITSRPGDHLDRFFAASGAVDVMRIDLSTREFASYSVADAEHYVLKCLTEPPMAASVAAAPPLAQPIEDHARDIAELSQGNFLYLYHLLDGLRKEMQQGRFELWASPSGALPHGLDGIYRYFVTERLRASGRTKRGVREWVQNYVPVLGLLAVARAPLTSSQLAEFSGIDRKIVDHILGEVGMFIETVDLAGDMGYRIFHSSFSDFLLTQDHTRNRYPFESATHYHGRIADYYLRVNNRDWNTFEDSYALMHLPTHLCDAGRIGQLCELLCGPFGHRQVKIAGPVQAHADCSMAARAAARARRDEDFLRVQERGMHVQLDSVEEWESGRYVLSLLSEDPATVRGRVWHLSSQVLPWAGFLAAERLLDLGALWEARDVLRSIERRFWSGYRPPQLGLRMMEKSSFDFSTQDGIISFLARVAQYDAPLTLALTKRLFAGSPEQLPNVRTAWRDVINVLLALVGTEGSIGTQITAEQCWSLADTTCQWLREGGYAIGWVGITQALFPLLVLSLPAVKDPLWLANAVIISAERRFDAEGTLQGASEGSGLWAACADVLMGVIDIWEALNPAKNGTQASSSIGGSQQLREALEKTWQRVAEIVPPVDAPITGSYSHRTAFLGHLAYALHRAGSQKWASYAEAALSACALDGALLDAPLVAVAEGLRWLRRLPDADIATRVGDFIEKFDLARQVARAENEKPGKALQGISSRVESIADGLKQLAHERDDYERGQLILAIWNTSKGKALKEIETRLAEAYSEKQRKEASFPFPDLLAEAIVPVIASSQLSWTPQIIEQLDACRTSERQKAVKFDMNALHSAHWDALKRMRKFDVLRTEAEAAHSHACINSDFNKRLGCCLTAISFDPDLANHWYRALK